ncbi:hypothetical protein E4U21_000589 [Claviceps maximensis]|nr:hypothetical protein E4U21_000589 [Claviceps maximensis]
MQSFIVSILAIASLAMAAPSNIEARTSSFCTTGLLNTIPQCCSANVLNLADLDCQNPTTTNVWEFKSNCASVGREAMCCSIPIAGQALLCNPAIVA